MQQEKDSLLFTEKGKIPLEHVFLKNKIYTSLDETWF